jgi:glutaredoxin
MEPLPEVVLYGRPDCHLCDEARELLLAMRGTPPAFDLNEIDIESDERLLASYLERIPVVVLEGEVLSELVLDPGVVRAKLGTLRA